MIRFPLPWAFLSILIMIKWHFFTGMEEALQLFNAAEVMEDFIRRKKSDMISGILQIYKLYIYKIYQTINL
jgi:hypothetical protein